MRVILLDGIPKFAMRLRKIRSEPSFPGTSRIFPKNDAWEIGSDPLCLDTGGLVQIKQTVRGIHASQG